MSKFNRFLSSILAIVMIVTSLPVNTFAVGAGASSLGVYTDTTATTTSSGNGNTAGKKLYFAVSNENLTGYKLQLVFYPLSDKTYYEEIHSHLQYVGVGGEDGQQGPGQQEKGSAEQDGEARRHESCTT